MSSIEAGDHQPSAELAIKIERLTNGQVTVAELREDLADVRVQPQATSA